MRLMIGMLRGGPLEHGMAPFGGVASRQRGLECDSRRPTSTFHHVAGARWRTGARAAHSAWVGQEGHERRYGTH